MFLRQKKTTYILGVCCFTRMQVKSIWVIKSFICALNKYPSANQISGSQWLIFRVVSKVFEVMDSNFKITKLTLHFQRTPRMQVFNFWHSTYKVRLKKWLSDCSFNIPGNWDRKQEVENIPDCTKPRSCKYVAKNNKKNLTVIHSS